MEDPKGSRTKQSGSQIKEEQVEEEEVKEEPLENKEEKEKEDNNDYVTDDNYDVDDDDDDDDKENKVQFRMFKKKEEVKEETDSEFSYDYDEEEEEDELSVKSSVLSEISFIWEDEVYKFEELRDPGNIETIFKLAATRKDYFDEFGIEQYLGVCNSLNVVPMQRLLRSLKTEEIDLSYRNIDGHSVRAMCAALEVNNVVSRLILRYNKLTPTDCWYIGYVLLYNERITHLDLTGCRIGPEGLEGLIAFLGKNLALEDLLLSKCYIQDEGMRILSPILMRNNAIKNLDLSYNNLGDDSGEALAMALKVNTTITDLNLRYNNLFDPIALKQFYWALSNNQYITRLDLSWNGLSGVDMGTHIGKLLRKNQGLEYLDLSDNRFEGLGVLEIKKALPKAKSLQTLKMGKNPMSPEDLDLLLTGAKANPTLRVLDLEDLWVKKSFLKILSKIKQERDIDVNFAGIFSNYEIVGPDYAAVILKRAQYEAQKPKRQKLKRDFGHLMFNLGDEPITQAAFMELVKKFKAKVNKQLYPELLKQFTMPKSQLIDVVAMRNKYLSLFPDSTPPPPKVKKGKTKDKGKDKKKKKQADEEEEDMAEGEEESKMELMIEFPGEYEDEYLDDAELIQKVEQAFAENLEEGLTVSVEEEAYETTEEEEPEET